MALILEAVIRAAIFHLFMWRFHEWPPLTCKPTGDDDRGVSEASLPPTYAHGLIARSAAALLLSALIQLDGLPLILLAIP